MKLNFSFKQAYDDLFKTKVALKAFLPIIILLLLSKIPLFGYLVLILIFGGFTLIAHNLIRGIKPVIPNNVWFHKTVIISGFKVCVVNIIYFLIFILYILCVSEIGKKIPLGSNHFFMIIYLIVLSSAFFILPVTIYIIMLSGNTIFAENLNLRQGFNLIKLLKTHKYVWKEYLLIIILSILSFGVVTLIPVLIILIIYFFLGHSPANITNNEYILNSIVCLSVPFVCLITYFYVHLIAQSYKYALSQPEPDRFISAEIKENS